MLLFEDLEWRGLVNQVSSPKLRDILNNEKINFYIGTDPNADSLHLGHYSSFLTAKRLAMGGHTPIILLGGATSLIGDPRGTEERELSKHHAVENNTQQLKEQIFSLFPYEIVNNIDWTKEIVFLDFLTEYGKLLTTSYMSNKDLVKRQMDSGISFAEFSYMTLQGMDFCELLKSRKITLQLAGSDQWGNITTGIELVRKKYGEEVYGMTIPLITDENGKKFGKSEGNAVWLSASKTPPADMYQFLYNVSDEIVISLLKKMTLLSKEEILKIESEHQKESQYAQQILAQTVVYDIHHVKL